MQSRLFNSLKKGEGHKNSRIIKKIDSYPKTDILPLFRFSSYSPFSINSDMVEKINYEFH